MLVGVIVTLIALAGAFLGVANVSQAESLTAQMSQRYLVLPGPVRDLRGSAAAFQVLAAEAFNDAVPAGHASCPAARTTPRTPTSPSTPSSTSSPRRATPTWRRTWRPAWLPSSPRRTAWARSWPADRRRHRPRTWPQVEEAAQANLDATLASLQDTIGDRLTATADQAHAAASRARDELLWSIVIGVAIAGTAVAIITRHALRVEHEQARNDAVQSDIAQRIAFESSLQTALEMSRAEPSVFDIVAEALSQAAPDMRSELLLADSSKAHFRQVLVSSTQTDTIGCGVISPDECPAA